MFPLACGASCLPPCTQQYALPLTAAALHSPPSVRLALHFLRIEGRSYRGTGRSCAMQLGCVLRFGWRILAT